MRKLVLLIALPLLVAATWPEPTNYVVDQAGKLSAGNKAEMTAVAKNLASGTGPEVAVAVVDSISPETIESYSIKLAEKWKVGKAGKNNGVILVVAVKERKVRIEVGYGIEPILPDAKAGRIISDVIVPRFKSGDMDGGIKAGFDSIVKSIGGAK